MRYTESGLEINTLEDVDYVKCSNCNKSLMMVKKDSSVGSPVYNFAVGCAFCGDKSYYMPVYTTLKHMPVKGVSLVNVETLPNGNVYFHTKAVKS